MKYILTYDGKEITRTADTAEEAVEKLCSQYGWRCRLRQYDADTRGHDWAESLVDTEGGTNWNRTILSTREGI